MIKAYWNNDAISHFETVTGQVEVYDDVDGNEHDTVEFISFQIMENAEKFINKINKKNLKNKQAYYKYVNTISSSD